MKKSEYIFGIHPVIEAISSGKFIDKILFQSNLRGEQASELLALAKLHEIPIQRLPLAALNKITRKNHQGIIAYLSPIEYQKLDEIIIRVFEQGKVPFVLILDQITDVRNMGAIARSAECAGVDVIVVPEKGGARIGGDAIKTSAGALLSIPVHRSPNLEKTIKSLKDYGLTIVSCTEKTDAIYTDVKLDQPLAIIMGSEGFGISNSLLRLSDYTAKIPLLGTIESLNVSVATGVLLYEVVRQRNLK